MRKEVSNVSAGGRRGRWSTCERGCGRPRVSIRGRLKGLLGRRGEPCKTEALSDEGRSVRAEGGRWLLGNACGGGRGRGGTSGVFLFFLVVVDKVAAYPIGAETDGVKRTARLCFVFRMSVKIPQLVCPVGKLALPAILAQATLGERSTQFSLIA